MEDLGPPQHLPEHAAGDHHCGDHNQYVVTCEACQRARAAFLPYQNVDPNAPAASRSFQSSLGPAFPPIVSIGLKEAAAYGVAEGVTRGIIDLLLDI